MVLRQLTARKTVGLSDRTGHAIDPGQSSDDGSGFGDLSSMLKVHPSRTHVTVNLTVNLTVKISTS